MTLANTWEDSDAHLDRLAGWGFKRWVRRDIELPAPGLNDLATHPVIVSCSIIEYGSAEQAREATQFLWDYLMSLGTENRVFTQVSGEQIGEWSLLGIEDDTSTQQQVIRAYGWSQVGSYQYNCRATSGIYNSLDDVIRLVTEMTAKDA